MKQIIILTILLATLGCQKKNLIIDSDLELTYAINGILSDSNEIQTFSITKIIPIKDFIGSIPVSNAKAQVEQNGLIYNFIQNDTGAYQSEFPFAIISGEEFTVEYEIDTFKLIEKYIAAKPIIIKDIITVQDSTLKIFIKIESAVNQFFTYKIFNLNVDSSSMSNSWNESVGDLPFQLAYANSGTHNILLVADLSRFSLLDTGSIVRIEVTPISKKVKNYFVQLNDYYETVATYNLYVSAPKFYSNQFYGLTYATSFSTIIDSL